MTLVTRKFLSCPRLKRTLLEKLRSRRRLKLGNTTLEFIRVSYFHYLRMLSLLATKMALSEGKTQTSKAHILEAHQKILEETKVRRKQRTLDEMVKRK